MISEQHAGIEDAQLCAYEDAFLILHVLIFLRRHVAAGGYAFPC